MAEVSKTLKFNDGHEIPVIGLGTYLATSKENVVAAIKEGWRHFDCAAVYGNESEIGLGFKLAFEENLVKREDLFITSKLHITLFHPDNVEQALRDTLKRLCLEYLDLYIMHWPTPVKSVTEDPLVLNPLGVEGAYELDKSFELIDTYKSLEKCRDLGLTKSIGVSNFNIEELKDIVAKGAKPAVNQIEFHPYLQQMELKRVMKELDIALVAYCPLAVRTEWGCNATRDPVILKIADKHKVSGGQVLLRWGLQIGNAVIPKTENPLRLKQNLDLFSFSLDKTDMDQIAELGKVNRRLINLTYRGGDWVFPRSEADIKVADAVKASFPTK